MAQASNQDPLGRLESLSGQIQGAKDRHRLGDALDAAVQAVDGAESAIERLEELVGFTRLIRGFLDQSDREQCFVLLNRVRTLGQHLFQVFDTATLQDGKAGISQLATQVEQFDRIINRGWKTKINNAFAATGQLGGVLREISETRQLGLEMEEIVLHADQLEAGLVDAEESGTRFEELAIKRDRSREKLTNLGAGKEVVDFLSAVANQSATLVAVTTQVRTWLDERNALGRFKVEL